MNLCKINPLTTGRMINTFSSTGLLGNDLSDIMVTLCLIHWLRYLIMFWYSTHLMSMSCGDGKGFEQRRSKQSQRRTEPSLTLGLIPSAPSGTFGKASYSVETYVMTDFSSGDWTSTSVEGGRGQKGVTKTGYVLIKQDQTTLTLWVQEPGNPQLLGCTESVLQIWSVGLCRHSGHVDHVRSATARKSIHNGIKERFHKSNKPSGWFCVLGVTCIYEWWR